MTHSILGELEKEHKAQKAPGATAEAAKPDADADELREKFRIVRVSPPSASVRTAVHEPAAMSTVTAWTGYLALSVDAQAFQMLKSIMPSSLSHPSSPHICTCWEHLQHVPSNAPN